MRLHCPQAVPSDLGGLNTLSGTWERSMEIRVTVVLFSCENVEMSQLLMNCSFSLSKVVQTLQGAARTLKPWPTTDLRVSK